MTAVLGLLAATTRTGVLWRLVRVGVILRAAVRLPRVAEGPRPENAPLVSVLVPVRNEERCLASLSARRYPHLEIVVVDEGSTDQTPAILAAETGRDPRIRPLRLSGPRPLAGRERTFALHTAASAAGGTWLCFTDADTVHDPAAFDQPLGFTQARGLAMLSMTSRQLTESPWEKSVQPVVFGLLDQWYPLARVNDPPRPRRPPTASSSWDARGL